MTTAPVETPDTAVDHEAHGNCRSCGYPVHQYPFGWQHVGSGMFSCSSLIPVPSCCDAHQGVDRAGVGPIRKGRDE